MSRVILRKSFKQLVPPRLLNEKYLPYPLHRLLWRWEEDKIKLLTCFANINILIIHSQMTDTKQVIKENNKCLEIHLKHMVDIIEDNYTVPQVFWRIMHLIVVFVMLVHLPSKTGDPQERNCLLFSEVFIMHRESSELEVDYQLTESTRASSCLIDY